MAITKRDIDRLAWIADGARIQLHPDGTIPGLSVRVYPSGKKAFVLRYRPGGAAQPKLLTIGAYGVLTLQQAREMARKALVEAQRGADPLEARQKARDGDTVRDLARVYLERHAKPHKRSWPEDERRIDKYILPAFGAKRVVDVKRSDVARLHGKMGETYPVGANRLLAQLRAMFNLAVDWGMLPEGAPNPATRIAKFKEQSRDRWVTPAEMPALWSAIEEEPNPYVRAAFKLYLFSGLRRNELLGLRWKDIDLDRCEIHMSDTKAGRSHVVALSAPAVEVLRDLPRQLGNAYVFPGSVPGKPLVNISKPWLRVRKRAGLDDVHLHDLRRTVGSWLATSGASLPLIGKVLNHSNVATTAIYARLAEGAPRAALEAHGAHLVAVLNAASANA